MEVLYPRCAAIDVHKKQVTVCVRLSQDGRKPVCQVRTFGTFTPELLELADWLEECQVTHVAMESTGPYWRPVYRVLEDRFELLVANAQHVKNVPGRKTDVRDAEWLADLLAHGLLKPSFVPEPGQRALRDLTRGRSTLVRQRSSLANRIQKLLEESNVKLGSVASDVLGVSGRDMLRRMSEGQSDPATLAELARGKLRDKMPELEKALTGLMLPHQRVLLGELLRQVESLDRSVARLEAEIFSLIDQDEDSSFKAAVLLLQSAPGIAETSARTIVSEIGTDMGRFGTDDRLCAWGGCAPANRQSAGKRLPGGSRHGNPALLTCLTECACSVVRMKDTYLHSLYRRIAARRGKKRALLAVGHSLLRSIFHMLKDGCPYKELGADHFDKANQQRIVAGLTKRLTSFGYQVVPKEAIAA